VVRSGAAEDLFRRDEGAERRNVACGSGEGVRIALHNAFFGQQVAETELARRMATAAGRLGWEAREVATSTEILAWRPDFVLALHFFTPKLTPFPTYGCLWNPPAFLERDPAYVRSVLSYDGYLTSSERVEEWTRDLLHGLGKQTFFAPLYTSCPARPWRAPNLDAPRLVYIGTNWDGPRYEELFRSLEEQPFVDVYGPAGRWAYAAAAYRGPLPFDGETVLDVLNRSGIGLCLHRPEHREAGIPSPRIFEIVASGAVAICQDHPFIRETFGDAVLYLDDGCDPAAMAAQIEARVRWIAANRDQALAMSQRAHALFQRDLSLETLLAEIERRHQALIEAKGQSRSGRPRSQGHVQVVVRAGERRVALLTRALTSIAEQTYPDVSVLVVRHGEVDLEPALAVVRDRVDVEVVDVPKGSRRSTALWAGLAAAKSDFVANLDDDDAWFPNHLATLVPLVGTGRRTALAYAGAVCVLERDTLEAPTPPREPATLAYYQPFERDRLLALDNYITSNAWVARRDLVKEAGDDPRLDFLEDLVLLLRFAAVTDFAFSGDVTAEFFHRTSRRDNATYTAGPAAWQRASDRIRRMLWKHPLAPPRAPLAGTA